ncbi:MAG: hypothetical protein IPF66_07100 [Holophagales bacterium]|nr:hypothetical protein [Holophagales bacterium]
MSSRPSSTSPTSSGAIAAANTMSDVWAMGGRPVLALNLVALPPQLSARPGELLRGRGRGLRFGGAVTAGRAARFRTGTEARTVCRPASRRRAPPDEGERVPATCST